MNGPVAVERVATAEALLEVLRPNDKRWRDEPHSWMYRGHAESFWKLVPTALRGVLPSFNPDKSRKIKVTHERQVARENSVLVAFLDGCDAQGLPFPDDDFRSRIQWRETITTVVEEAVKGRIEWPPANVMSMLALAQHYGVPTRLLDWSVRPLHAAYFAARDATKLIETGKQKGDHLVIWGLSKRGVEVLREWHRPGLPYLTYVVPPPAQIPNAKAQRGLLTLVTRSSANPKDPPETFPIEEVIVSLIDAADPDEVEGYEPTFPWLHGIATPAKEAPKLLRLLEREFVSAAYLFPGYASVVAGLEERRYWDRGRSL